MTETVEIRWFLPGPLPATVGAWVHGLAPAAETEARTDRYLVPATDAIGEKWRDGHAERKTRTSQGGVLRLAHVAGPLEHWHKIWISRLPDRAAIDVDKRRRTVRVDAPGGICSLEVGTARVDGETWWTVCLEVNGPSRNRREEALQEVAQLWLGREDAPALPAEAARGYPAWLRERVG